MPRPPQSALLKLNPFCSDFKNEWFDKNQFWFFVLCGIAVARNKLQLCDVAEQVQLLYYQQFNEIRWQKRLHCNMLTANIKMAMKLRLLQAKLIGT